jgi:hypothetical protein
MDARRRRMRPHRECAESRAGRLSRLAEPEGASGVESSDMAPRVRSEGSLPFIWWLCWTGTYGAARVASSASTRCRWKAACHILPPHRHGPAGGSRSGAARDGPSSPGNLRPSRSGEPSGIDLPPKPRSGPYYACPRRLGSPPCGRPWSAACGRSLRASAESGRRGETGAWMTGTSFPDRQQAAARVAPRAGTARGRTRTPEVRKRAP